MAEDTPLLEVRDLRTWFGPSARPVRAVNGVSFSVARGETLALVGESGCGKTVTALSLARLLREPPAYHPTGQVLVDGRDVFTMPARDVTKLRGRGIAYVFQEPGTALNPVLRVGAQVRECLPARRSAAGKKADMLQLMREVGLPDTERTALAYPHELSGGMQQRVMLAMALASGPDLLVADEPTTALDVTIQAQVLELLAGIRSRRNMAAILITHNLGLVAGFAERICVMYSGRIVEAGPTRRILTHPAHPYTVGLMRAAPRLDLAPGRNGVSARLEGIPGTVPDPQDLPEGCTFRLRCTRAGDRCRAEEPTPSDMGQGVTARCHFPHGRRLPADAAAPPSPLT